MQREVYINKMGTNLASQRVAALTVVIRFDDSIKGGNIKKFKNRLFLSDRSVTYEGRTKRLSRTGSGSSAWKLVALCPYVIL